MQIEGFEIKRKLFSLSYGLTVYEGKKVENGQPCIIRVANYTSSDAGPDQWYEMYGHYELTVINYKHLPRLHTVAQLGGSEVYAVLEAPEGQMLQEAGRLTMEQVQQLLEAVHHLHSKRLIHGSIVPQNVWLTNDGRVLLYGAGEAQTLSRPRKRQAVADIQQLIGLIEGYSDADEALMEQLKLKHPVSVYELATSLADAPQEQPKQRKKGSIVEKEQAQEPVKTVPAPVPVQPKKHPALEEEQESGQRQERRQKQEPRQRTEQQRTNQNKKERSSSKKKWGFGAAAVVAAFIIGSAVNGSNASSDQTSSNTVEVGQKINDSSKTTSDSGTSTAKGMSGTGYVLPESSTRRLTADEVDALSQSKLRLARNELFARYGYVFKSEELKNYFSKQSWYVPNPSYTGSVDTLNDVEKYNLSLIRSREAKITGTIFPDSSDRKLANAEVEALTTDQLRIARNEIFARYGYVFKSEDMNQHFSQLSWYKPDPSYNGSTDVMNAEEKYNIELLKSREASAK